MRMPVSLFCCVWVITAALPAAEPRPADRAGSVARFENACRAAGLPTGDMLVGAATSMEKILPRAVPFQVKVAREFSLSVARNEKESLQVLVLPTARTLRKVSVHVTDLSRPDGVKLPKERVDCHVVGYVETKQKPPYDVTHVGWWPDPILDFTGPVDIAQGDLQAFWVRVRAPKEQPPGWYRGTLSVTAEGVAPVRVELSVRVRSFTLPDHSPLPLAITFSPEDFPTDATRKDQDAWRKNPDYPVRAWKSHRLQWADFLADYYISYDSLYHRGQPDFEVLEHLHRQGRLGAFNLGYYGDVGSSPAEVADWKAENLPRFRAAHDRAASLGLLDHAYIYGADEAATDRFPRVERAAAILKAEFPDVMIMTTTYDQSYGQHSVIKSMDAFCPLTPSFDPVKARAARAAGKQVWWYICCGPHHPHANMFVEYPAIDGRLLMGAMTARQRPDGFLYYQISIWNARKPITSGPFTDWDPRSWTSYHGDGSWTCVGPGGTPLPTIRLENFRDGLEDYAYAVILDTIVHRRAAAHAADSDPWLTEARAALQVPTALVKSMTDYSRDPLALYAWRDRMADVIEQSGATDVDPWGKAFGVRGFASAKKGQ